MQIMGDTVVMIIMQRMSSLKCEVFPEFQLLLRTYADAATANTSRMPMKARASLLLTETVSSQQLMLRNSSPFCVQNPVRMTKPTPPPEGGEYIAPLPARSPCCCWTMLLPQNKM